MSILSTINLWVLSIFYKVLYHCHSMLTIQLRSITWHSSDACKSGRKLYLDHVWQRLNYVLYKHPWLVNNTLHILPDSSIVLWDHLVVWHKTVLIFDYWLCVDVLSLSLQMCRICLCVNAGVLFIDALSWYLVICWVGLCFCAKLVFAYVLSWHLFMCWVCICLCAEIVFAYVMG